MKLAYFYGTPKPCVWLIIITNKNGVNHGTIFYVAGRRGFPAGIEIFMFILFAGIISCFNKDYFIGQRLIKEWIGR
jgi:hypothetical protein